MLHGQSNMTSFSERLHSAIREKGTAALVGLDPRYENLPSEIITTAECRSLADREATRASAYEEFCLRIIDVVSPLVPAVKPQAAFFEECGPAGMQALGRVIRKARESGLIVICDAKRGDIGSTAEAYAKGFLAGEDPDSAPWAADALTVNPYLGRDTLEPFVEVASERGAGIYVLVRTSNPGAGTFQDCLSPTGSGGATLPLYRHVAEVVEDLAAQTADEDDFGCVGAVVGATYPQELAELRAVMPHAPFLVPGYGSQGGSAADVAAAFKPDGLGALVNSSRGIIFAYLKQPYAEKFGIENWEQAVEAAIRKMIADLAQHTSSGQFLS